VDVKGDGGDFEGGVLFLAGPDELGIEVRIVFVVRCVGVDGSVWGVTRPTGGLLTRFLPLWSYCSMGRFLDLGAGVSCSGLFLGTKGDLDALVVGDFTRPLPGILVR
jgi:hypothetical protein